MSAGTDVTAVSGDETRSPWTGQVKAFALRSLRREFHHRSTLFWSLGSPVLWFALFAVALGDATPVERAGLAVVFGFFGTLSVALVAFSGFLVRDLRSKRYRKLRSLPVSVSADLAGRFLAGLVMAAVSFLLVIGAGVATGGRFSVPGPAAVGVVALALVLFTMVGAAVAVFAVAVIREPERLNAVTSAGTFVLFFLTGYNGIRPELLPESVRWVVNVAPNSLATRIAVVQIVPAGGEASSSSVPVPEGPVFVALLAAYAVVLSAAAVWAARRFFYEGEVGER